MDGLGVGLLLVAGVAVAGFQVRQSVCSLRAARDWDLCEKDGLVYLTDTPPAKPAKWYVSAPTIKDANGRFLAGDPDGRNPSVQLIDDKRGPVQWAFEIVSRHQPGSQRSGGTTFKVGTRGLSFRIKMAGGPFEAWYLATEALLDEDLKRKRGEVVMRPLKLVKDPKKALVLIYIQERYEIGHK